jgi:hypothetical protein
LTPTFIERTYIEAMGGQLEILARFPAGVVRINQFHEISEAELTGAWQGFSGRGRVRNLSVHTAITLLIAATQACASGTGLPPVFGQFRRASECEGPRPVSRIAISGGSTTETGTNRVRLIANTLIDLKQLPSPAAYGHVLVTVTSVDGHAWSAIFRFDGPRRTHRRRRQIPCCCVGHVARIGVNRLECGTRAGRHSTCDARDEIQLFANLN